MQLADGLPVEAASAATSLESPACGPEPVTTVPDARSSSTDAADQEPHQLRAPALPTSGRGSDVALAGRAARSATATVIRAVDEQEVRRDRPRVQADEDDDAAEHGVAHDQPELRSSRAGSGCAGIGFCGAGRDDRPADGRAQHVRQHAVAELDGAVEAHLVRWPSGDSSVHLGQVGQPSPEPVSRTAPPVTTMTTVIDERRGPRAGRSAAVGVQRSAMKASGLRTAETASARVRFGTGTIVGGRLCTLSRGGRIRAFCDAGYAGRRRVATPSGRSCAAAPSPSTAQTARIPRSPQGMPAPCWSTSRRPSESAEIGQQAEHRLAPRRGTCPAARSRRRRPAAAGRPGWRRPASPRP